MTSPNENNLNTSNAKTPQLSASDESDLNEYNEFMSWRESRNINSFGEDVFMEYFRIASETHTPEMLSALFFALKTEMRSKHSVQIGKFILLFVFLRQKGVVIQRKPIGSSKSFTNEEIHKFLTEAPDAEYLAIKAAAVIGIYADCRFKDLRNIRVKMVNDYGTEMIVRIPDRRTNMSKVYAISGEFADIVRKYFQKRSATPIRSDRFFHQHLQTKMGRKIAEFLELDNPESYTGHSFRKTSSKLADKECLADTTDTNVSTFEISLVAESCDVGSNDGTNSIGCMSVPQETGDHDLSDTCSMIDLDTDDETSQAYTVDSSLDDDQDDIEYVDHSGQDIITNNCTLTEQHRKSPLGSDIEIVNLSPEPSENVHYPNDDTNNMGSNNVTHQMLQTKIDQQAKEIDRLKQLTEKQSIEIEILKDLLEKSIKQGIRNEM